MNAEKSAMKFSWRVYSLGVMALGLASLAFGNFDPARLLKLLQDLRPEATKAIQARNQQLSKEEEK